MRVYRLMREVGPKKIADTLLKDRAGSALIILLLMGILVLEFGSLAILRAEKLNPDANIKTASDAIWYTMVTISTVGYGDRYPTTNCGQDNRYVDHHYRCGYLRYLYRLPGQPVLIPAEKRRIEQLVPFVHP